MHILAKPPIASKIMIKHHIFEWGAVAAVRTAWCINISHRVIVFKYSHQAHCAHRNVASTSDRIFNDYSNEDKMINDILFSLF